MVSAHDILNMCRSGKVVELSLLQLQKRYLEDDELRVMWPYTLYTTFCNAEDGRADEAPLGNNSTAFVFRCQEPTLGLGSPKSIQSRRIFDIDQAPTYPIMVRGDGEISEPKRAWIET